MHLFVVIFYCHNYLNLRPSRPKPTPEDPADLYHTQLRTNRKRVCNFLLVINSNLGPILHRFWDAATYWPKKRLFSILLSCPCSEWTLSNGWTRRQTDGHSDIAVGDSHSGSFKVMYLGRFVSGKATRN